MKTITVRLPEALVADIESESRTRRITKSAVVRERLQVAGRPSTRRSAALEGTADLIGPVDDLPPDLSSRKKAYLKTTGYGQRRAR